MKTLPLYSLNVINFTRADSQLLQRLARVSAFNIHGSDQYLFMQIGGWSDDRAYYTDEGLSEEAARILDLLSKDAEFIRIDLEPEQSSRSPYLELNGFTDHWSEYDPDRVIVRHFNTFRHYSRWGQGISLAHKSGPDYNGIFFIDHARGLSGWIEMPPGQKADHNNAIQLVSRGYVNAGGYSASAPMDYRERDVLEKLIHADYRKVEGLNAEADMNLLVEEINKIGKAALDPVLDGTSDNFVIDCDRRIVEIACLPDDLKNAGKLQARLFGKIPGQVHVSLSTDPNRIFIYYPQQRKALTNPA